GPIVAAQLRAGRIRLTRCRPCGQPGLARARKSWWRKDRLSNQSRTVMSMALPFGQARGARVLGGEHGNEHGGEHGHPGRWRPGPAGTIRALRPDSPKLCYAM